MFFMVGMLVAFGSILLGYTMHGGAVGVLIQVSELIIIGSAALGAVIVANKPGVVPGMVKEVLGLLKPSPNSRQAYAELLQVLYERFYAARRDGLVGIEGHIEDPEKSGLFRTSPKFQGGNHHAISFLADTMKVMLTGAVDDHHLAEILELHLRGTTTRPWPARRPPPRSATPCRASGSWRPCSA